MQLQTHLLLIFVDNNIHVYESIISSGTATSEFDIKQHCFDLYNEHKSYLPLCQHQSACQHLQQFHEHPLPSEPKSRIQRTSTCSHHLEKPPRRQVHKARIGSEIAIKLCHHTGFGFVVDQLVLVKLLDRFMSQATLHTGNGTKTIEKWLVVNYKRQAVVTAPRSSTYQINSVGTSSWFFMPISTAVRTRKSSRDRYRRTLTSNFMMTHANKRSKQSTPTTTTNRREEKHSVRRYNTLLRVAVATASFSFLPSSLLLLLLLLRVSFQVSLAQHATTTWW
jgi:hypothetical protein